jgi:molybdopterin-guanine dinucleotide biosynthesis protein A
LSTRYAGKPKGLELVRGVRIIDRVRAALEPVVDGLLLIANDDAAGAWLPGVRWERDVLRDVGSVAGIHAALVHSASPVLVVAWDMPFVPTALLAALRDAGHDADLAVPESDSRRGLEPLCAFYTPACVPAIERRIAAGDRRVIAFYDDVRVVRLDASQVARFGDPALLFMNVNTPEERILAEAHGASTDGGRDRQEA